MSVWRQLKLPWPPRSHLPRQQLPAEQCRQLRPAWTFVAARKLPYQQVAAASWLNSSIRLSEQKQDLNPNSAGSYSCHGLTRQPKGLLSSIQLEPDAQCLMPIRVCLTSAAGALTQGSVMIESQATAPRGSMCCRSGQGPRLPCAPAPSSAPAAGPAAHPAAQQLPDCAVAAPFRARSAPDPAKSAASRQLQLSTCDLRP